MAALLLHGCLLASWVSVVHAACAVSSVTAMHTLSPSASGYLRSLAWVPAADNGGTDLLVAGGEDQKLQVWSLSGSSPTITSTLLNTLGSIHGTVWALTWISTHSVLASGSGDGFIRIWPLSVITATQTCHVETNGNANALCCDGDGLGCEGQYVVSWRDAQMTKAAQVHALAWMDADSILASAWGDGVVRLWTYTNANSPPLAFRNSLSATGRAYSLSWLVSPVSLLAVASPDWTLPELWDKDGSSATTILTQELPNGFGYCPTAHCGAVGAAAGSSDGATLATASDDTKVKLWTASTGELSHTYDAQSSAATAVAWLDSESKLLAGGSDGSLYLYDTANLGSTAALFSDASAHSDRVTSVIWMSTLDAMASTSYDLTVKLWHCAS